MQVTYRGLVLEQACDMIFDTLVPDYWYAIHKGSGRTVLTIEASEDRAQAIGQGTVLANRATQSPRQLIAFQRAMQPARPTRVLVAVTDESAIAHPSSPKDLRGGRRTHRLPTRTGAAAGHGTARPNRRITPAK